MKTIKGPAILLAQFAADNEPYNSLAGMAGWAARLGYKGIQIPTSDQRLFDLRKAASSKAYCDEIKEIVAAHGLEITELATALQGQLVAVNPAYDAAFDAFAAPEVRGDPKARTDWAIEQLRMGAKACQNLGIRTMVTFSGAFAWPFVYPWPQRPSGLVEASFGELAKRWRPIFDYCDENDVNVAFELHPSEDVFDGVTFEMLLDKVGNHPRCGINYDPSHFVLQCLDYLEFIDLYHGRIFGFHVKDAEFNPSGRQGVYGGYQPWLKRAGRFRSPGDGQVDFKAVFSKLAEYDYDGWAVLEWECCIKSPQQGAEEGAPFIRDHIIQVTERAFDDFARSGADEAANRKALGIP